jgi:hypothetical protein
LGTCPTKSFQGLAHSPCWSGIDDDVEDDALLSTNQNARSSPERPWSICPGAPLAVVVVVEGVSIVLLVVGVKDSKIQT